MASKTAAELATGDKVQMHDGTWTVKTADKIVQPADPEWGQLRSITYYKVTWNDGVTGDFWPFDSFTIA